MLAKATLSSLSFYVVLIMFKCCIFLCSMNKKTNWFAAADF